MLVLLQHCKAHWVSCLAATGKQIISRWENGVGMAPLPLFDHGTWLLLNQWPLVSFPAMKERKKSRHHVALLLNDATMTPASTAGSPTVTGSGTVTKMVEVEAILR